MSNSFNYSTTDVTNGDLKADKNKNRWTKIAYYSNIYSNAINAINIINYPFVVQLDLALLLLVFAFLGCKGGDVSITQLGSELASPSFTKTAAGKISGCSNQFTEYKGVCTSPVSEMEISLDQNTWQSVPSSMPIYDSSGASIATAPAPQTLSCSNGDSFDFKISSSWVAKTFNTTLTAGAKIYLRGSIRGRKSAFFSTTLLDSGATSGPGCGSPLVMKGSQYMMRAQLSSGAGSRDLVGSTYKIKGEVKHVVR